MKNYQALVKKLGDEKLQLQNYEEIIGILDKIELHKNQGVITLVFTFQKKIDLPLNACDKEILVSSLSLS